MQPSIDQLKAAKTRYEILLSLLNEGQFPGQYSEAVTASRQFIEIMSKTIQEQIGGNQSKDASSNKSSKEAPGVGDGGVPNKRRRKGSK